MTLKVTLLQISVKAGGWSWLCHLMLSFELSLRVVLKVTHTWDQRSKLSMRWDGFSNLSSSLFELESVLWLKGRIFFWLWGQSHGVLLHVCKTGDSKPPFRMIHCP
jgi:hypothetical protein